MTAVAPAFVFGSPRVFLNKVQSMTNLINHFFVLRKNQNWISFLMRYILRTVWFIFKKIREIPLRGLISSKDNIHA